MNRLNKTNRKYNYTISEQPSVIIQIRYEISLVSIYSNDQDDYIRLSWMNHMVLIL
jgi:hypothetical protein